MEPELHPLALLGPLNRLDLLGSLNLSGILHFLHLLYHIDEQHEQTQQEKEEKLRWIHQLDPLTLMSGRLDMPMEKLERILGPLD